MTEPEGATGQETTETPAAETGTTLLTGEAAPAEVAQEEVKQDEVKPEGEVQTDNKDAKPVGAPEKYEFSAIEGLTLDEAALGKFEPVARELNLTQEQANKLVTIYAEDKKAQVEAWGKQLDTWVAEAKADKEIGGAAFDTNLKHAQSAIARFGSPELKTELTRTGMGNHPELIRIFAKIGKAMAEDQMVPGGAAGEITGNSFLPGSKRS